MQPVWEELTTWGNHQANLRIREFNVLESNPEGDAIKHKHGIQVDGVPLIVKIVEKVGHPAQVVEYHGNRELADLRKFARASAST
jgi:hypothetical protein